MIDRVPETARAILDKRAKLLARPAASNNVSEAGVLDLLNFQVGSEVLTIPLSAIAAIARTTGIAPLPRAVSPVYGVTAWRGRPLTVLALAAGRPAITPETRLLVLGTSVRAGLAIVVDAVHDVARTTHAALAPAGPGPRLRYALGITTDGLLVVDGDALLHLETLRP